MTDKELIDIVLNFMIAGRDTTAAALSWSIHEFIKNEAVAEEMIKEIRGAVAEVSQGSSKTIFDLNYEDSFSVVYSKLPYCRAAL